MGFFDKLFGRKTQDENCTKTEIAQPLVIDLSQTPEPFQPFADEIVHLLRTNLQKLHLLEEEIFIRNEALRNPKEPNQVQPGQDELWEEYKLRSREIKNGISLKPTDEGSGSLGKPTQYKYVNYPNTKYVFIMKSKLRAVVEVYFKKGKQIDMKDQFVFKKEDEQWKINTKKYGFLEEDKWYKDSFKNPIIIL